MTNTTRFSQITRGCHQQLIARTKLALMRVMPERSTLVVAGLGILAWRWRRCPHLGFVAREVPGLMAALGLVRSLHILVFCATFLSLVGAGALNAAVITIPASVDADIHTGTATIEDALDLVNVSLNRVGVFEFDVAAQIPTGSIILSATFRGFSEQVANSPEVDLIGYPATDPAAIALADATIAGVNLLSVSNPAPDSDFAYSLLAVAPLQSALDGSGVFGLRAERTSASGTWRIRSLDSLGPFPRLEIEYAAAVPEPSTFFLAGAGLFGLGCVALRKRLCRA